MRNPSFYKYSRVEDKYSTINNPKIKKENILTDYDSTHHVRVMKRFQTPLGIPPNDPEEEEFLNDETQKDFFLRCYLPKSKISRKDPKDRIEHVIIMFNGLNECERFDFYDVMGAQFAGNDFASILLPTPFHLNRRKDNTKCAEPRSMLKPNTKPFEMPTDIAYKKDALYFYSFKRSLYELESLVDRIKNPHPDDHGFFEHYFSRDVKITLFGFSLGGLRALACFLRNPKIYHSCITFNTGADLERINTEGLKLDAKIWKDSFYELRQKFTDNGEFISKHQLNESADILRLFKLLYLGIERTELTNSLREHSDNYFSIQSGADALFKGMQIDPNLAHPDHGLNRLIIGGVGHIPTLDLRWDNWLSKVGENIVHFINGRERVHWAHAELEDKIEELIQGTEIYRELKAKTREDFDKYHFPFEDFERLRQQIEAAGNDSQLFVELYYISKTFYPSFAELLEKIIKPR